MDTVKAAGKTCIWLSLLVVSLGCLGLAWAKMGHVIKQEHSEEPEVHATSGEAPRRVAESYTTARNMRGPKVEWQYSMKTDGLLGTKYRIATVGSSTTMLKSQYGHGEYGTKLHITFRCSDDGVMSAFINVDSNDFTSNTITIVKDDQPPVKYVISSAYDDILYADCGYYHVAHPAKLCKFLSCGGHVAVRAHIWKQGHVIYNFHFDGLDLDYLLGDFDLDSYE